jgi:acyl-CoA reductase-like NAD-dependent aldehyde dehydrogenase
MTNVPAASDLSCEEVFAPVVIIEPYDTFSEAIAKANSTRYGLQIGVFTSDEAKINEAYEKLEVGGVIINDTNTFRIDTMPYGGIKDSGFGREGVRYAMQEMCEEKVLVKLIN